MSESESESECECEVWEKGVSYGLNVGSERRFFCEEDAELNIPRTCGPSLLSQRQNGGVFIESFSVSLNSC